MTAILVLGQVFAVLYGLAIGSFLAVCVVRLPEDRSLLVPSSCPHCAHKIRWRDNIPVLSWLWLRARCRDCGERIGSLHPALEALGAVLALLVFRHVFRGPEDLDLAHAAAWVVQFSFLSLLVVAAAVDVRHRIIPDQTSSLAVPFGIAAAVLLQWLGYDGWLAIGWRASVAGAVLWGGAFWLFSWGAFLMTGQVALGWGDVKLVAMLGAFLGAYPGAFLVVLMGSVLGSVVGILFTAVQWRRVYLPYGPPLAIAGAIYVLWGDLILHRLFPNLQ